MIAHPGIYLAIETDDAMHSLINMSNVYLELTTNWGFPGGEGLMWGFDEQGIGRSGCGRLKKMDGGLDFYCD